MTWKIAQAKQHLSDVIRRAARQPQVITNRDRAVATVISAEEFEEFLKWKSQQATGSIAQALSEARRICDEEEYALPVTPRADRENPLVKGTRAPARHKRHQ